MKIKFIIFALLISISGFAQDVIVKNSGDTIKGYNIEISDKSVFYTLNKDNNAPVQKLSKDSLLAIRRENGEKVVFDNGKIIKGTIDKAIKSINNIVVNVKQSVDNIGKHPETNIEVVRGDSTLPDVDVDNYKGFLLKRGNVVYVEYGSSDYEQVGGNRLRKHIKEDGFWKLADRIEQAHFVIVYYVITTGKDHIYPYYLNLRRDFTKKELKEMDSAYEYENFHYIGANESLTDNIKFADKLYERILYQQKNIERVKNPEKDALYRFFCQ